LSRMSELVVRCNDLPMAVFIASRFESRVIDYKGDSHNVCFVIVFDYSIEVCSV
jgi:hypothetical protein